MSKVKVVSGYVQLPTKQLTVAQFKALGARLVDAVAPFPIRVFDDFPLYQCWLTFDIRKYGVVRATCPSPPKDRFVHPYHMVLSNVVLLQKAEWVSTAAAEDPEAEQFVYLDYGIFKQSGVNALAIQDFLYKVKVEPHDAVSLPGIWEKRPVENEGAPHWRFAGSTLVIPRKFIKPLLTAIKAVVRLRLELTGEVPWDMNTLAHVEMLNVVPIRWYPGNHDASQFTGY
jgi:hypothetical protein